MRWRNNIRLRLNALIHRRVFDRDLEEEIHFHLAMRERKLQDLGLGAEAAHYAARAGVSEIPRSGRRTLARCGHLRS